MINLNGNCRLGFALDSYYDKNGNHTEIGEYLHKVKYLKANPNKIIKLLAEAIKTEYSNYFFDLIICPYGRLSKKLSNGVSDILNIPFDPIVPKFQDEKMKDIDPKYRQDYIFNLNINYKNILIIDDFFQTGTTIKSICNSLPSSTFTALAVVCYDDPNNVYLLKKEEEF